MEKLILITLLLIFCLPVLARPVKRITFPKGATKTAVTGYLNNYKDSQTYLIRLRKGQRVTLDASSGVSLFITGPDGEDASDMDASCHSHQIVENTMAGEYKIEAVECQKADPWKGSFKLTVEVVESNSSLPDAKQSENIGSPMQKTGDITELSQRIEQAQKIYEAHPYNSKGKNNLAAAYFERAFALTKAAQYNAALGDFRKGLKLNPNDQEAKGMHDQIVWIYKSLGKEAPKEGEEKAPHPVEKKPLP
jgi:tetratricopeptide (TPR) repeat protein